VIVGAAAVAAHQAGYLDLQFKDKKLPSTIREQNFKKMYEDLKSPFEQKVDQKQTMPDHNGIAQEAPKDLPTKGVGAAESSAAVEQPTHAEEKETETLTQVQDEHKSDAKLPSQDTLSFHTKPNVVNDEAASEVPPGQSDKIGSTLSPLQSSPSMADPSHDSHTDTDAPKV
jgi:mitofilin